MGAPYDWQPLIKKFCAEHFEEIPGSQVVCSELHKRFKALFGNECEKKNFNRHIRRLFMAQWPSCEHVRVRQQRCYLNVAKLALPIAPAIVFTMKRFCAENFEEKPGAHVLYSELYELFNTLHGDTCSETFFRRHARRLFLAQWPNCKRSKVKSHHCYLNVCMAGPMLVKPIVLPVAAPMALPVATTNACILSVGGGPSSAFERPFFH